MTGRMISALMLLAALSVAGCGGGSGGGGGGAAAGAGGEDGNGPPGGPPGNPGEPNEGADRPGAVVGYDPPPSSNDSPPSSTDTPPSSNDSPPSSTDTPPSSNDSPPRLPPPSAPDVAEPERCDRLTQCQGCRDECEECRCLRPDEDQEFCDLTCGEADQ